MERKGGRGEEDIMMEEYGLFAKDMALNLGISTNTLRRWAIELEKNGYKFSRNEHNQRLYYERDIMLLFDFQKTIQVIKSLDDTAKSVIEKAKNREEVDKKIGLLFNENVVSTKEQEDQLIDRIASEVAVKVYKMISADIVNTIEFSNKNLAYTLRESIESETDKTKNKGKTFIGWVLGRG